MGWNIKGKLLMTAIRMKKNILQQTPDIFCISSMNKTVDNVRSNFRANGYHSSPTTEITRAIRIRPKSNISLRIGVGTNMFIN